MIILDIPKRHYIANDVRPGEAFMYRGEMYLRLDSNGWDTGGRVPVLHFISGKLEMLPIETATTDIWKKVLVSFQ